MNKKEEPQIKIYKRSLNLIEEDKRKEVYEKLIRRNPFNLFDKIDKSFSNICEILRKLTAKEWKDWLSLSVQKGDYLRVYKDEYDRLREDIRTVGTCLSEMNGKLSANYPAEVGKRKLSNENVDELKELINKIGRGESKPLLLGFDDTRRTLINCCTGLGEDIIACQDHYGEQITGLLNKFAKEIRSYHDLFPPTECPPIYSSIAEYLARTATITNNDTLLQSLREGHNFTSEGLVRRDLEELIKLRDQAIEDYDNFKGYREGSWDKWTKALADCLKETAKNWSTYLDYDSSGIHEDNLSSLNEIVKGCPEKLDTLIRKMHQDAKRAPQIFKAVPKEQLKGKEDDVKEISKMAESIYTQPVGKFLSHGKCGTCGLSEYIQKWGAEQKVYRYCVRAGAVEKLVADREKLVEKCYSVFEKYLKIRGEPIEGDLEAIKQDITRPSDKYIPDRIDKMFKNYQNAMGGINENTITYFKGKRDTFIGKMDKTLEELRKHIVVKEAKDGSKIIKGRTETELESLREKVDRFAFLMAGTDTKEGIINAFKKIPGITEQVANALYEHGFRNLQRLMERDVKDLAKIKEVGSKRAEQIKEDVDRIVNEAQIKIEGIQQVIKKSAKEFDDACKKDIENYVNHLTSIMGELGKFGIKVDLKPIKKCQDEKDAVKSASCIGKEMQRILESVQPQVEELEGKFKEIPEFRDISVYKKYAGRDSPESRLEYLEKTGKDVENVVKKVTKTFSSINEKVRDMKPWLGDEAEKLMKSTEIVDCKGIVDVTQGLRKKVQECLPKKAGEYVKILSIAPNPRTDKILQDNDEKIIKWLDAFKDGYVEKVEGKIEDYLNKIQKVAKALESDKKLKHFRGKELKFPGGEKLSLNKILEECSQNKILGEKVKPAFMLIYKESPELEELQRRLESVKEPEKIANYMQQWDKSSKRIKQEMDKVKMEKVGKEGVIDWLYTKISTDFVYHQREPEGKEEESLSTIINKLLEESQEAKALDVERILKDTIYSKESFVSSKHDAQIRRYLKSKIVEENERYLIIEYIYDTIPYLIKYIHGEKGKDSKFELIEQKEGGR